MNDVKRYDLRGHDEYCAVVEDDNGAYVPYRDYAALEARCLEYAKTIGDCNEELVRTQQRLTTAAALLSRAGESLNDYCAELNGDMNDSLATEIELFLGTQEA